MGKTFDLIADTKEQWNELGFYYDYNKETKGWLLEGTREGMLRFAETLKEYASKESNGKLGEHEHLGPYMYLTIVTADLPQITDYGIFGSLADLSLLARQLQDRVEASAAGDVIEINSEYSDTNEAALFIKIRDDGFDPSEPDKFEWVKE